jgi:hypothetical protein
VPDFPITEAIQAEIVGDLEQMLEDARAGRIVAYVFAAVTSDANMARGMVIPGGAANGLLYMALDQAKDQIRDRIAEAFAPPAMAFEDEEAAEDPIGAGVEVEDIPPPTEDELALARLLAQREGHGPLEIMATDPEGGDVPDMAAEPVVLEEPKPRKRSRKGA